MQIETKMYFKHGDIVAQSGDVRVYDMDDQLFLEIGPKHDLWALESEYAVYMEQLRQHKPYGDCLEIGLGLGVASRCILTFPEVKHLTTVEMNKDVINVHENLIYLLDTRVDKWLPYEPERHTIINQEGLSFLIKTDKTFDFIFMDFYKLIDEDTLPVIKDMVQAAKPKLNTGGVICGWLDPHTPAEFYEEFEKIFR